MTKKIEDGGPAFPSQWDQLPGMDLRDWFAGQALPAIIERCSADYRPQHESLADYFARRAYDVADAMLLARKAGEA